MGSLLILMGLFFAAIACSIVIVGGTILVLMAADYIERRWFR